MKKVANLLLAVAIVLSLSACGNQSGAGDTTNNFDVITEASEPTATELTTTTKATTMTTAGKATTTTTKATTTTTKVTTTTTKATTTHIHNYSSATCTEPAKCSCGAIEGKALGHNYIDGKCSHCGSPDPNHKEYDTYLNGVGYNLGTELTIDIVLKTNDTDISICPAFTYYKKTNGTFAPYSPDASVEDWWGEEPTLPVSHGGPIFSSDDEPDAFLYGHWRWMGSGLLNDKVYDFSQGNVLIRLKYVVAEKGEFEFRIRDGATSDQNNDKYTDSLSVRIYEWTDM